MKKKAVFEVGIYFMLFVTQIACMITEIFKLNKSLTTVVYTIGLLCLLSTKSIRRGKVRSNKQLLLILVYNIYVLFYGILTGSSLMEGYFPLIYTVFCLALIMLLVLRSASEVNNDRFIRNGWLASGILSVILLWLITDGFKQFSSIAQLTMGTDRLTLSVVGSYYMMFFLVYSATNKRELIIKIVFFVAAVLDVFLCSRKGFFIVYAIILIVWLKQYMKIVFPKKYIIKIITGIGFALVVGIIMINTPFIKTLFDQYMFSFTHALLGYVGKASGIYNTGAIRNNTISNMLSEYKWKYSITDYIFGKGYMYASLDFAYLQVFMDLGVFAGLYYLYIQMILPIKMILKRPKDNMIFFLQMCVIFTTLENIFSGTPYGHTRFVPLILLLFFMNEDKNRKQIDCRRL